MITADTSSALAVIRGDSARVAVTVYTVLLLATIPLVGAVVGSVLLRRSTAAARVLVWRSAAVALLLAFLGRAVPLRAVAWAVPSALAAPLVALGRVQVTAGLLLPARSTTPADAIELSSCTSAIVQLCVAVYVAGVCTILIPTVVSSLRMRRALRAAAQLDGRAWGLGALRQALGVSQPVRIFVSPTAVVPMTWGFLEPVIVLPFAATRWNAAERRIVLLHELTHVRAADWVFNLVARAACALYWFHPGAWWVARALRADCELACDDRVIASGIRRSEYADLLVKAADALRASSGVNGAELALTTRTGLRARLAAVLDPRRDTRPLARGWAMVAAAATIAVAGSMSTVRLAPTRDLLTTLMADTRWESRAYAVLGLAQRSDSVAVARSAAERDPSPRVRAWARYALGQTTQRPADLSTSIDKPNN